MARMSTPPKSRLAPRSPSTLRVPGDISTRTASTSSSGSQATTSSSIASRPPSQQYQPVIPSPLKSTCSMPSDSQTSSDPSSSSQASRSSSNGDSDHDNDSDNETDNGSDTGSEVPPEAALLKLEAWKRTVHFNGEVYFHHPQLRIYTGADITAPSIYTMVCEVYLDFLKETREDGVKFPHDYETEVLVVKFDDDGEDYWEKDARVFSYGAGCTFDTTTGKPDEDKRLCAFFTHLSLYPMGRTTIPHWLECEFLSAMVYGSNEHIMGRSRTTTFPYDSDKTDRILRVYWDLKSRQTTSGTSAVPALIYHIVEAMDPIYSYRLRHKFGTRDARTSRDLPPLRKPNVYLDAVLFVLLLGSHMSYRERLYKMSMMGQRSLLDFRKLMKSLVVEWSDSNLLATVFASANVAFLAVPDITTLQRTASLASTIFSILSIAAGVHHVWQHRSKTEADLDEAGKYIDYAKRLDRPSADPTAGADMTLIASFLCIPLAMLMWAVLAFSVALGAACVQGEDKKGMVLLALVMGMVVLLGLAMLLFFHWRRTPSKHASKPDASKNSRMSTGSVEKPPVPSEAGSQATPSPPSQSSERTSSLSVKGWLSSWNSGGNSAKWLLRRSRWPSSSLSGRTQPEAAV